MSLGSVIVVFWPFRHRTHYIILYEHLWLLVFSHYISSSRFSRFFFSWLFIYWHLIIFPGLFYYLSSLVRLCVYCTNSLACCICKYIFSKDFRFLYWKTLIKHTIDMAGETCIFNKYNTYIKNVEWRKALIDIYTHTRKDR